MRICFWLLLVLPPGFSAGAQTFAVDRTVIAGGGGVSTNGAYSLAGTIGQSAAGSIMAGGNYSLAGGFWSLISVVQTPGAPTLSITHTASQIVISWPTPGTNWTLQQNANLAVTGGWTTSGFSVLATNGISSVTISAPTGNLFFRLSQP